MYMQMQECLSFLIEWDPSLKLRCLMISLWSYTTAHRASVVPANLGEDKWRAGESFIIEINASAHGK